MPRTKEGSEYHQRLVEMSMRTLKERGYDVARQATINDVRLDVLGFKEGEKVGVECLVRPNKWIIEDKVKRYAPKVDHLIFAYPKGFPISLPEGIEGWSFDMEVPSERKLVVSLSDELEEKVRLRAKEEYEGKRGAISIIVEKALKKYFGEE
jgi:hypothetical protein